MATGASSRRVRENCSQRLRRSSGFTASSPAPEAAHAKAAGGDAAHIEILQALALGREIGDGQLRGDQATQQHGPLGRIAGELKLRRQPFDHQLADRGLGPQQRFEPLVMAGQAQRDRGPAPVAGRAQRALLDQPPVAQHQHMGRVVLQLAQDVRGDDDGHPLLPQPQQRLGEPDPRFGIQPRGRLVEKQDRRVMHDALGDGEALAKPAGERAGLLAQPVGDGEALGGNLHGRRPLIRRHAQRGSAIEQALLGW